MPKQILNMKKTIEIEKERGNISLSNFFRKWDGYLWEKTGRYMDAPLGNYIFYGPEGSGRYTLALNYIRHHSDGDLRGGRILNVTYNKAVHMVHMSDIHFEVDMGMLGSSAKALWYHMMQQIYDIVLLRKRKIGIIMCKNFQAITNEHMEIMQTYVKQCENGFMYNRCRLYYVILTTDASFIGTSISSVFSVVRVPLYMRRIHGIRICDIYEGKREDEEDMKGLYVHNYLDEGDESILLSDMNRESMASLGKEHVAYLKGDECAYEFMKYRKEILTNIESHIYGYDPLNGISLRNSIYDILIYHMNLYEVIWSLICNFSDRLSDNGRCERMHDICMYIHEMLRLYDANYRPILHIEKLILYLARMYYEDRNEHDNKSENK
jgi:hypothetical protein